MYELFWTACQYRLAVFAFTPSCCAQVRIVARKCDPFDPQPFDALGSFGLKPADPPHPFISTVSTSANAESVAEAARLLQAGALVAFPTETVYGLGADATNSQAVARIFAAKGRPFFNPLISHVPDVAAARRLGLFDEVAEALASAYWPGPMTLIVPARAEGPVCDLARAGLNSIAIRVPAHPVARALLEACGRPVVAPSANRSGHVSPTQARHVLDDLDGAIEMVLDGGPTGLGLESTIIACLGGSPSILRPGSITRAMVEAVAGRVQDAAPVSGIAPIAPGQLRSHYAPRAAIRLDVSNVAAGEALLAFGSEVPEGHAAARAVLNLSEGGDLTEAAANLYAMLRALDETGAASIAVAVIPREGLGEAIRDRLDRAAAPR
ncbi:MAG: threonylcarbamoyl-AMP synthase [Beijerinckiaceae bacterium]|nr:threonylcarbamoyl-AMP synthase [Beijerinckiaceae bacterium]